LGITVENITPDVAREMNLTSDEGVLVTDVRPGSPADEGGVRSGDVIRAINHVTVKNASDLQAVARDLKSSQTVLLRVSRDGQTMFLAFDLA
jgi:S1-C subfamily serine protease